MTYYQYHLTYTTPAGETVSSTHTLTEQVPEMHYQSSRSTLCNYHYTLIAVFKPKQS